MKLQCTTLCLAHDDLMLGAGSSRSGRATVARSGPASARILRNPLQGFGIRDALCAGESCNTELTTKAGETKVKRTGSGCWLRSFVWRWNEPDTHCISSVACWTRRNRNPAGSDNEYREIGISSGNQALTRWAFLGTYLVGLPTTGLRARAEVQRPSVASAVARLTHSFRIHRDTRTIENMTMRIR
jgi:hypothetical protein